MFVSHTYVCSCIQLRKLHHSKGHQLMGMAHNITCAPGFQLYRAAGRKLLDVAYVETGTIICSS